MVLFPNCKINLGLNIVSKRQDGYHNIETVFLPVALQDALEVIQAENGDPPVALTTSGLHIGAPDKDNLCIKAYWLLKKDYPLLPAVKIHLHKSIPMGAGLGGGSANGACTLIMLNKKFGLGITSHKLVQYALQLGSDCPFFILNKPCFAQQRGEELQEISLGSLLGHTLLVVNPGIHVNTGWAFSQITPAKPLKNIAEVIQQPLTTWKDELHNDFEAAMVRQHPVLVQLKAQLYKLGAIYAGMSGSGSTFYGIFEGNLPGYESVFPSYYMVRQLGL